MFVHFYEWKHANRSLEAFDASTADRPFIVRRNVTHLVYENAAQPIV
jgi:hypothetical protein